jgi:hypothetical protein
MPEDRINTQCVNVKCISFYSEHEGTGMKNKCIWKVYMIKFCDQNFTFDQWRRRERPGWQYVFSLSAKVVKELWSFCSHWISCPSSKFRQSDILLWHLHSILGLFPKQNSREVSSGEPGGQVTGNVCQSISLETCNLRSPSLLCGNENALRLFATARHREGLQNWREEFLHYVYVRSVSQSKFGRK